MNDIKLSYPLISLEQGIYTCPLGVICVTPTVNKDYMMSCCREGIR